MSAKTCMVVVYMKGGSTVIIPSDSNRLSKTDAQRRASEALKEASVLACSVVSEIMQVNRPE